MYRTHTAHARQVPVRQGAHKRSLGKRMDDQNGRNQLENADREVIKMSELDRNTAVGDLIEH